MKVKFCVLAVVLLGLTGWGDAQEQGQVDDSDSPNILYVVPWVEVPQKKVHDPKLVIHGLMGDLYEPQLPEDF